MKPTEQLKKEHESILLILQILKKFFDRVETEGELKTEHLNSILEFLKIFVDKCHHGKEEELLFPALEAAGISYQGGPLGAMVLEHNLGRGFVQSMSIAFENFLKNDRGEADLLVESGRNYIGLLTHHIKKENTVLFPLADRVLSPDEQPELEKAFEQLENERIGPGKHEELHQRLHGLKEFYKV